MTALALIMSLVQFSEVDQRAEAFTSQVLQQGSTGEDVIELQSRLKHIGFYTGKIDGVFGWGTYWALRNFQYEFGLEIDGVAGWKTKLKLAKATPNAKIAWGGETQGGGSAGGGGQGQSAAKPAATNTPNGFSQNDIQLMANAVYGEARGEPYTGQVAVAAVILNRLDSATFPNTISGVIFEPRAFTAVADGQIWLTPNETAKKAVLDAINGWDPTGNAMYYFNPDTATSAWIWSRPQIKKIGKHIFCK
ncbi:spore cortex-lytic enzyme [Mesobacillus subterraneus]|nr:spore cortex-lytic enzyme [Mesobacillus subterraneus]WLR57633.1 spore cortex-lytic enzyme [Mesobacillus subterraneus]